MTRGERNANPGNVRLGALWIGMSQVQTDPDFVQFDDVRYGIRAIGRVLLSYEREGLSTIRGIIDRWAPPVENNTSAYVTDVAAACWVHPDDTIDVKALLPALIPAIIVHENGADPYTADQIAAGITLV